MITITVPIPQSDQNKRMHHRAKAKANQVDRDASLMASQVAIREHADWKSLGLPWRSATLHVRWYHPTARHRDPWNIVGCLKGTLDGIVLAGVLTDDDQVQPPTVETLTDRDDPRVEIEIRGAKSK